MLDEEPTLLNKEAKPFKFIEKELVQFIFYKFCTNLVAI